MAAVLKQLNAWKTAGGMVFKYSHASAATKSEMKFCAFVPPNASSATPVPALYWLSGLTCSEDNFVEKAGAFKAAARHGVALICPDTSPRGVVEGEAKEGWDFGVGAGFYVNAITPRWASHYRMFEYVTSELPAVVRAHLPVTERAGIFGHSMGGHGALIAFLRHPKRFVSCSAFAPICHPSACPWGIKAFTGYLGTGSAAAAAAPATAPAAAAAAPTAATAAGGAAAAAPAPAPELKAPAVIPAEWKAYDATELLSAWNEPNGGASGSDGVAGSALSPILVDQGTADKFLLAGQLRPTDLQAAAAKSGVAVTVNMREGYDHSYHFISTFVDDHIAHHATYLHNTKANKA